MGSRPAGFVLDAKSMGLNPSRPPSPSPSTSPSASQKCRQVQPTEKSASRLHAQSSVEASSHVQCTASTETMSTDHYRDLLQKLREANGDAGDMSFELNNIFLKRLDDIDCLDEHEGDDMGTLQLRLNTFQEWVDFLLHVNSMILGNVSDLEKETYSKIVACTQSVQGQQQQTLEENRRLRKDICAIIKHVQTSPHCKAFDFRGVSLETLTVNQVQGSGKDHARPECESEKMTESMKSLVSEIAAKHDEICNLKSQIKDLDDFVQTARQKLLLKDQCIAQLNQQLQEITQCIEIMSEAQDTKRDQEHLEDAPGDSLIADAITNDMLENLSIHDNQESEKLRLLNAELNELFDLYGKQDYQAIESRRKRLSCFFGELATERDDTVKKLETIRSQLRILQSDLDQSCLNPIAHETGHCELDADGQMLEALRRRLLTLNQVNRELHGKYQRLDTESKKLQARIESESGINQRNSDVLREIADLICKLGSMEFSYNEIYDESSKENPFCATIAELFELRSQQGQRQAANNEHLACQIQGLQDNLKDRDNQIDRLQSMIKSYSDFSENNRLKGEMHDLKQKNCDLSRKSRELSTMLKNQEDQRVELCTKYENLLASFEEQCQELKGAKKKVHSLQTRLDQVEQLQDELRTERKMLREEVIALKEKEAVSAGRERALQEQQKNAHSEVEKMRTLIRNMQGHLQLDDIRHRESVQRMNETTESLREELRTISDNCQQMQIRLSQQSEVNQQQEQIIDSFRKWKDAQVRADEAMRQCAKRSEKHIHMLLEENRTLAEDYRILYRDNELLELEMRRVKQAVNCASSSAKSCPPETSGGRTNAEAVNTMARRLQNLTSTSQRISNQNRTLNDQYCNPLISRSPSGIGQPVAQSTLRPARSSEDLS
ncbi:intracellular protein transport protein USO1 isoform X2 [Drosophila erecta]|uniref:intracellular protein transport protein USO1 isoform X2 n=1 Tax=Drosophila erecta TaxID=7220 RepID=UPI000F061E3A|nr:intracellular protein transport protein USO1 isoform X2 [Drosophila erecta]